MILACLMAICIKVDVDTVFLTYRLKRFGRSFSVSVVRVQHAAIQKVEVVGPGKY